MIKLLPFFVVLALGGGSLAADSTETPDTLQKLYTDGNYKELIPRINKVLALKGPEAAQFKKYDLLVMKGDASLHIHAKAQAMDAFKSAATATTTPDESSTALATAELIRVAGGNLTYLRKTKADKDDKPAPIDIVEPDSRKLAFAALETDILARVKPRFEAVIKSGTLVQAAQVASDKDLAFLREVEIAATGSAADTQQLLGDLGSRITSLLDSSLEQLGKRINGDIDAVNNGMKSTQTGNSKSMTVSAFVKDLNGVDSDAKQLAEYIKNISPLLADGTDLKNETEEAKRISGAAEKFLKDAKAAGY